MSKQTVIFEGLIDANNVTKLIDGIDTILNTSDDDIDVYFSSTGGEIRYMRVLVDYFKSLDLSAGSRSVEAAAYNNSSTKKSVTLKAFDSISSAGFEFFVTAENCHKQVLQDAYCVLHAYTTHYDYREDVMKRDSVRNMKVSEKANATLKDFLYTCGVPEDKILEVSEGKEIVLEADGLRKCIDEWSRKNREEGQVSEGS